MLYLIRGLPGSGKSTKAKSMGCLHLEADMYFSRGGEYKFDPSQIKDAHAWCQFMTQDALNRGLDVAVSNTFTQAWELAPYLKMVEGHEEESCKILKCTGTWENVHGVPQEALTAMKNRWQDISGEVVI